MFTTDEAGAPTLAAGSDHNGTVSIAQGTDSGETDFYTITLGGDWGNTYGVFVDHATARTCAKVVDSTAGTVELQFSDTMFSTTISVRVEFSATNLST
jgi:hypothetical protein